MAAPTEAYDMKSKSLSVVPSRLVPPLPDRKRENDYWGTAARIHHQVPNHGRPATEADGKKVPFYQRGIEGDLCLSIAAT